MSYGYHIDFDLVKAVCDEGEEEDAAEGREEPDPPGDPRLARFARDHRRGHAMRLQTKHSVIPQAVSLQSVSPGTLNVSRPPGREVL